LRKLAILDAAVACALLPATVAYARRQSPAYSYDAPPRHSHAVEVAPDSYVIRRAPPRHSQRALIEELRWRSHAHRKAVARAKIRHYRPVAIERPRVVEEPPRVVERRRVVEAPSRVPVQLR
jgi:hypothetical protein